MRKIIQQFILALIVVSMPAIGMAGDIQFYVGIVPPFTFVGESGEVEGLAVDVVTELMSAVNMPVGDGDIREISWARAMEDVETKPRTALFCVARTPQREHLFKWVGPIADLNLGLIARKSSKIVITKPEDLRGYRIGVVRNSAPISILIDSYQMSPDNLEQLKDDVLQFRMLNAGRVDLITQADTAAPEWLKMLNMNQDEFEMVHVLRHLDLYIAFNKESDDRLIKALQNALSEMKETNVYGSSQYQDIFGKYLRHGPIRVTGTE